MPQRHYLAVLIGLPLVLLSLGRGPIWLCALIVVLLSSCCTLAFSRTVFPHLLTGTLCRAQELPPGLAINNWPLQPFRRRLDHRCEVVVETLCAEPRVALARGLLSESECRELINMASPFIDQELHSTGRVPGRTSKHTTLLETEHTQHPVVQAIMVRAAQLVGVPSEHIEALQVVRYYHGQRFPVRRPNGHSRCLLWPINICMGDLLLVIDGC